MLTIVFLYKMSILFFKAFLNNKRSLFGMYIVCIVTMLLSIFSTAVMAYISMATPIGPWIAPTLVLLVTLFLRLFFSSSTTVPVIALSTIGGSLGGILATAFGFSFPTLYFLDKNLFLDWMAHPSYFIGVVGLLALAAGGFGLAVAQIIEKKLLKEEKMPFPIGQLVYKLIAVQNNIQKAWQLIIGLFSTIIFCTFTPTNLRIFQGLQMSIFTIPAITVRLDQLPMLWAIGFVTGHVILKPLVLGVFAKLFIVDPFNKLFFLSIPNEDFLMAFCSGIVVASASASFIGLPKAIKQSWNNLKQQGLHHISLRNNIQSLYVPELLIMIIISGIFLTYFKFPFFIQFYVMVSTFISSYQIAAIAGKIGLALLGRFATFVMVPAYILGGLSYTQLVIIATFVEASGGVATDALFGRKTAQLAQLPKEKVVFIQWLGLITSCITLGFVMWILIHHFGLGSEELTAQRSQARALLLNFTNFNYIVLIVGAIFGYSIEKLFKISPMLMLGGLLMSFNYSLLLILGGLSTYLVKNREDWEPFWSGVFAGNSIWVVIRALFV